MYSYPLNLNMKESIEKLVSKELHVLYATLQAENTGERKVY